MDLNAKLSEILPIEQHQINILVDIGLIDKKQMLRFIVKHEYFKRLKERTNGTSCFDIKMDLCAEFNVSRSFVDKCLYYYLSLKV